jgi:hypothetical protein
VGYYIRVKPKTRSLRMGTCAKLVPHYCVPFEVLEKVGPVAYKISLPPNIRSHNVFHVSLLKKYIHVSNHGINCTMIQVEPKEEFHNEPQCILDRKEVFLQNRPIMQVKVQWKHFGADEATWGLKYTMRVGYPFFLFVCVCGVKKN